MPEPALQIDLRNCRFVRPPAVLWCLVYPLLAVANLFYVKNGVPTSPLVEQLSPFLGDPLAWLLVIPALWLSPWR